MNAETTIEIPSLTKLDKLELAKVLDEKSLSFPEDENNSDAHGELTTTVAIVIVSLAALRVLAIWLAKNRKRTVMEFKDKDGSSKKIVTEESESEEDILKRLGSATNVDVTPLLATNSIESRE